VPLGLTGKSTDEANPIIVEWLATNGFLLNPKTDKIQHHTRTAAVQGPSSTARRRSGSSR